jgi:hypothetical protein
VVSDILLTPIPFSFKFLINFEYLVPSSLFGAFLYWYFLADVMGLFLYMNFKEE